MSARQSGLLVNFVISKTRGFTLIELLVVISLMAIALIAKAVSSRISPELYQQLANGWPLPQETESQEAIPASINEATTKDPDRPQ